MLGEVHSLENDFPEFKETIAKLVKSNKSFDEENSRYNEVDKEIRTLELRNGPIDDEAMHQLKHDRAALKDNLYKQLVAAQ